MRRFASLAMAIAIVLGMASSFGVARAGALGAAFTSSITYQNVGTGPATISMTFRQAGIGGAGVTQQVAQLNAGAGASLFVGSVSNLTSAQNSAVISSNQPLVATVVQFVNGDPNFHVRLLSNGLQSSDASSQYLIATTLLNKFGRTTVFSVQNTEAQDITATIKFYDADNNANLAATKTVDIPAQSSVYINMANSQDTNLGSKTVFNGSAIVTAVKKGTTTAANVVASANEYYVDRNVAAAFEGTPLSQAANTVYMATGLCRSNGLQTFYAVQNADLSASASVKITYRDTSGNLKTTDGPYNISKGGKVSIDTCNPSSKADMSGFSGSAVIESTGAKIVALGKAQAIINSTDPRYVDVFTIFAGQNAGATKLALPFVRWAKDSDFNAASNTGGKQRAFLAIQNLENKTVSLVVAYNDKNGKTVASKTLTIPALSKANSNASDAGALDQDGQFGYYNDGSFGGAVTITPAASSAGAKFIAIARVQNPGAGEDYNAQVAP